MDGHVAAALVVKAGCESFKRSRLQPPAPGQRVGRRAGCEQWVAERDLLLTDCVRWGVQQPAAALPYQCSLDLRLRTCLVVRSHRDTHTIVTHGD